MVEAIVQEIQGFMSTNDQDLNFISSERFNAVSKCITELRFNSAAQCVLLVDITGRLINSVGMTGHLDVTNPRLHLQFHMDWDATIFPWVVLWQPYGGAELEPLSGIYGLGIEPWTAQYNLAQAIAANQARSLAPGGSITTEWSIKIEQN